MTFDLPENTMQMEERVRLELADGQVNADEQLKAMQDALCGSDYDRAYHHAQMLSVEANRVASMCKLLVDAQQGATVE